MDTASAISRIERKLSKLIVPQKPRWVKVGFIQDLTGWNKEKMRKAREQGLVKCEKNATGIWYDINSLPPQFIKHS